jgi:hypothetical protein
MRMRTPGRPSIRAAATTLPRGASSPNAMPSASTRRLQPPLHDLSPPMAGRSGFQPSAEATTFQVVEYSHLFIIRT